ncbi:sulfur oxidation c-type cytochrome SoxX [Hydrogenimonas sp.]
MYPNAASMLGALAVAFALAVPGAAADLKKVVEMPDASRILAKDRLAPPKHYKMPAGCITDDPAAVARGAYIFHNLNGKKAKSEPPKGLTRFVVVGGKKKPRQFGNCVACHNIEGAKGGGNIGPDLHHYKKHFIDTGVRSYEYVYQQIADPRVHNENTHMTVNLTTGLFTPREICDIASYVVSEKREK